MVELTHQEAVEKLKALLIALEFPEKEDVQLEAVTMMPVVKYEVIKVPDVVQRSPFWVVPDTFWIARPRQPGWLAALALQPEEEVSKQLNKVLYQIDELTGFMRVLRCAKPRLEAIRLYDRLAEADWTIPYFRGINMVLNNLMTSYSERQGWLMSFLADMLFPSQQLSSEMTDLIRSLLWLQPEKLEPEFQTVVHFAAELTPFGVLHSHFYKKNAEGNSAVNLLTVALDILNRRESALPVVNQIARQLKYVLPIRNFKGDLYQFEHEKKISGMDFVYALVLNERLAFARQEGYTSFFDQVRDI